MGLSNDPKFWEWLKEKEKTNSQKPFEPIPLYITVEVPEPIKKDKEPGDIIDYSIDDSVIYRF